MPRRADRYSDTLTETTVGLERPKMYAVIMHNDDYTTMDFVVTVLRVVFKKSADAAVRIMQTVHKEGKCKVDAYPLDIAVTKKAQAERMAEKEGFPLLLVVTEE
jgi:ATP-dependent Clp protease adaptor protein ClpS